MKKYKKVIGEFYPEYFLVVEHPDQDVDFYMDMVSIDLQKIIDTVAKNLTKKGLPIDEMMGGIVVHGGAVKVKILGETIYGSLDFTGGSYNVMNNKQFIAAVKKSKYYKIKAKSIYKVYENGKWIQSRREGIMSTMSKSCGVFSESAGPRAFQQTLKTVKLTENEVLQRIEKTGLANAGGAPARRGAKARGTTTGKARRSPRKGSDCDRGC